MGGWNWFTRNISLVPSTNLWLWLFAALGMSMLWVGRWPWRTRLFCRPHYCILLLPVAALCMAVSDAAINRELGRILPRSLARLATTALFVGLVLSTCMDNAITCIPCPHLN